ncbi:YycH family regulatory protein [Paenibacillus humicola]|uniref:YycH family regulatory protein n=1 Tax=Paenibacillus humicola TaxID=3110540 RepID=UPI00237B93EE|nr:two-component system activity regulator YycH [Paenibacillus humicola]
MIEKTKTWLLAALVLISLLQSYFLAYSMPGLGVTVSPQQSYLKTEPMGTEQQVENVIFPEDMVLHMGKSKHTMLYPGTNFYNRIYEKLQSREFKGFEQSRTAAVNWNEVRDNDQGLELRFGGGVPVELLSKTLKIEGDTQFMNDTISRIWIFKNGDPGVVRTYFFSGDGTTVYESLRADLTAQDLQTYIGYGEYQTPYEAIGQNLYVPAAPIQSVRTLLPYELYTPEQMQRNLFFDPGVTRAISDRSGSQIYTDGKKGLQVEQNGKWISYTDPVAGQGIEDKESDNVYTSISFINEHGGWDGLHRLKPVEQLDDGQAIRYQQYYSTQFYGAFPIIAESPFLFGEIRLRLQQGVVSEYERTLITLGKKPESKQEVWLPGGKRLENALASYARRSEVQSIFPALRAMPVDDGKLRLEPVWAVRLSDGTQDVLAEAMPAGYKPSAAELSAGSGSGSAGEGAAKANGPAGAGSTAQSGGKAGSPPAG